MFGDVRHKGDTVLWVISGASPGVAAALSWVPLDALDGIAWAMDIRAHDAVTCLVDSEPGARLIPVT